MNLLRDLGLDILNLANGGTGNSYEQRGNAMQAPQHLELLYLGAQNVQQLQSKRFAKRCAYCRSELREYVKECEGCGARP